MSPHGQADLPQLVICMGVSGSGKSTLAAALAARLGWPMLEADDFHSAANRAHMAAGRPLDDSQREPWIASICLALHTRRGNCVLAYSGLRAQHRQRFRELGYRCTFLLLELGRDSLRQRLLQRRGHYMPATLLDSQFDALQLPVNEADVVRLDGNLAPDELLLRALVEIEAVSP